jgi:outer membrane receptor for ferric coprogen and ferric-rhodotorulic acid
MPLSTLPRTPALRPISLAVITLLVSTSGAWAQTGQTENPALAEATAATLGNVTVSGSRESASTRLPLTAKETPQSTATVAREQMDEQSLTSVDAVLRKVTGVYTSFHDTQRPIYYSRGFKISDFQVDGIPTYSSATNQEYDTAIYEKVDIVRGANGILTGIGVPSATVNLIRKRPQRQFGASVALSAGSWNLQRAELDLNAPLKSDGSVRSRLVLAPQKKESFRQRYAEDKTATLAVLEADVGNATVVSAGYQRQSNEPTAPIWGTIPRFTSTGAVIDLPLSTSFSPSWTRWERTSSTLFAKLEHQFNDDWALQTTLSRTEGDTFRLSTYGYGLTTSSAPFPNATTGAGMKLYAGLSGGSDVQDQLDGYVSGKFNLGGRKHDLVAGVSTSRTVARTDVYSSVAGWSYTIPNIYTWDGTAPAPTYSKTGAWRDQITQQTGVYASARWRLSDPLSVLTGLRVTHWQSRTESHSTTGAYTGTSAVQEVKNELTPYLGVVYDITPQLAAYGSYTRIFNPQNYKDRYNTPLDPVVGSSAEVGVKTDWLDKRIQASLALFQTQQDNYGVVDSTRPANSLPDGSTPYVAVNGTKSHGFELDVTGQLNRQWRVNAGLTKATITRAATDLIYANIPEHLLRLGTDYQFGGALAPLSLGGDLQWQSETVGYNIPAPSGKVTVTEPSVALLNLRATWKFSPKVSATLALNNLTNRKYWANIDYGNYGDPRNVMLTVRAAY